MPDHDIRFANASSAAGFAGELVGDALVKVTNRDWPLAVPMKSNTAPRAKIGEFMVRPDTKMENDLKRKMCGLGAEWHRAAEKVQKIVPLVAAEA